MFLAPSPLTGEGWGEGGMPTKLTNFARKLRTNPTDTESLLWRYLRAGRVDGYKFKRQQPLGGYIVDFVCFESRLIIELDGGQHADQAEADKIRDQWLNGQGFQVVRFWNNEVMTNLEGVLQCIHAALSPSPRLSVPTRGLRSATGLSPCGTVCKGEGENQGCAAPSPTGRERENLQCATPSPLVGEGWGEGNSKQVPFTIAPSPLVGEGWGEGEM